MACGRTGKRFQPTLSAFRSMPVEHQQCDDEGSPDSSIRSSYFSRLSSSASPASMSAEFPICRALKRTPPSSLDETPISPGESPYSVDSTASSAISPISSTRFRSRNSVLCRGRVRPRTRRLAVVLSRGVPLWRATRAPWVESGRSRRRSRDFDVRGVRRPIPRCRCHRRWSRSLGQRVRLHCRTPFRRRRRRPHRWDPCRAPSSPSGPARTGFRG